MPSIRPSGRRKAAPIDARSALGEKGSAPSPIRMGAREAERGGGSQHAAQIAGVLDAFAAEDGAIHREQPLGE